MVYKKRVWTLCTSLMLLLAFLTGCSNEGNKGETKATMTSENSDLSIYDEDDYYLDYENETYTKINLNKVDENVYIKEGGTYVLSGILTNGSVIVEVSSEEVVRIILLNATIHCEDYSPIYVKNAKKTIISLPKGSKNIISDGNVYQQDSNETSAAIFSKDDLTFNGTGKLVLHANYKNGIQCKDTLKMMEGNYKIIAQNDGIKSKDCLMVRKGSYHINASGDAIVTTAETENGELIIEKGTFVLNAAQDGIQSASYLTIYAGTFSITCGGGSVNSVSGTNVYFNDFSDYDETDKISMKGIKAKQEIIIEGGTYTLSCVDDAIHSDASIHIKGGTYTIASDDDGIHAALDLFASDANINVTQSYEGLEGATITIDSGAISLCASDDGMNATSDRTSEYQININGGTIYIDAYGDGVDSNGSITMNDGVLIVMGSDNEGNGALDYENDCVMNKGTLIAVGTSGMAMMPSASSTQNSLMIALDTMQNTNTTLYLSDQKGNVVVGVTAIKAFNNVVISTDTLTLNDTYTIYLGGNLVNSTNQYAYQANGGSALADIVLSSNLTTYGNIGMSGGMPNTKQPFH